MTLFPSRPANVAVVESELARFPPIVVGLAITPVDELAKSVKELEVGLSAARMTLILVVFPS